METGVGTSTLRSLGRRASLRAVVALLEAASDAGVRYVDTADTYGAGSAERAVGAAVRRSTSLRSARGTLRVITKGGYLFPDLPVPALNQPAKKARSLVGGVRQRFDAAHLERASAASLRRLGGLVPFAYCLHNPPRTVLERGEALGTLERLQQEGRFQLAGISLDHHEDVAFASGLGGVQLIELPAEAWLAQTDAVRDRLRDRGVTVVVNRVGLLGGVRAGLTTLVASRTPPDVAIIGTRDADHLRANVRSAGA